MRGIGTRVRQALEEAVDAQEEDFTSKDLIHWLKEKHPWFATVSSAVFTTQFCNVRKARLVKLPRFRYRHVIKNEKPSPTPKQPEKGLLEAALDLFDVKYLRIEVTPSGVTLTGDMIHSVAYNHDAFVEHSFHETGKTLLEALTKAVQRAASELP